MNKVDSWAAIEDRIRLADERYGPFSSTHEALGVAAEEWDELREAIRRNDFRAIRHECLDLAAPLIRLARAVDSPALKARSIPTVGTPREFGTAKASSDAAPSD